MKFSERINLILNGRKLYPWANALHISNGVTNRFAQDIIPGSEILTTIMRKENVSLNWLADGKGKPFYISIQNSDESMAQELSMHLEDFPYTINLIHDSSHLVIELSEPAQSKYKGKAIDYVRYEHITGSAGAKTRNRLLEQYEQFRSGWNETTIDTPDMERLRKGWMGPYELYGDEKQKGIASSWPINTKEHLLNVLNPFTKQPGDDDNGLVKSLLMRAVIEMVERIAESENIQLTVEQKARVYTTAYRHAAKAKLAPDDLDPNTINSIIEML